MPIRQDRIPASVTPTLMAAFNRTISPERWRTYERAAGFHTDTAHRLYLWNAAVGQGFHYPLQTVEVCLRNVIHLTLTDIYGANWAFDDRCRKMFRPNQVVNITKAERRYRSIFNADATTPQIIASLSLGFWVAMLSGAYDRALWSSHSRYAFPHLSRTDTMSEVSQTAMRVQALRNRIFHQEPLIGHNLSEDYAAILRLLGWICPEMREWVRRHTSVPRIIRERPR